MPYPMFDRSRLHLKPLVERVHDMQAGRGAAAGCAYLTVR